MLRTVLVCRVVDSFCAHCSMVRPLSQQGRRMLLNDSSLLRSCLKRVHPTSKDDLYIELSMVEKYILLAGHSDDTKDDGDGAKVHEMRMFLDKCLQTCPSLRPSLCYNHVVAHGPPQLQLPHRRHGWSHARYIVSGLCSFYFSYCNAPFDLTFCCFICFVSFIIEMHGTRW
jgi:hypothetical protein